MDSKLKIYLRGLGIGIMVTALILAIVNLNKNKGMSDAEVIARAKELGMVSANSYSLTDAEEDKLNQQLATDGNQTDSSDNQEDASQGGAEDSIENNSSVIEDDNASNNEEGVSNGDTNEELQENGVESDSVNNTDANTQAADNNRDTGNTEGTAADNTTSADNTTPAGDEVSITVAAGSGSETLSASLLRAGLIDDSKAFNTYMVDNGYSTKIRVGTFKIPMGSTYEEICKIVTGTK